MNTATRFDAAGPSTFSGETAVEPYGSRWEIKVVTQMLRNRGRILVSTETRQPRAMEAKIQGTWKRVGPASVNQSIAKIKVKLPRSSWGRSIFMRATAAGRGYLATSTRASQVKVL